MTLRRRLTLLLALILGLFVACDKSDDNPPTAPEQPQIRGTVSNSNGDPLGGVRIHATFALSSTAEAAAADQSAGEATHD